MIYSAGVYFLIAELRPLILSITIEKCVLIADFVLLIFGIFYVLSGIMCFSNYEFAFLSTVSLLSSARNIASCIFFKFGLLNINFFKAIRIMEGFSFYDI